MKAATTELAAQFERATGNRIVVEFAAAPSIKKMLDGGAKFDAIILASELFKELSGQGKVEPGTATPRCARRDRHRHSRRRAATGCRLDCTR